MEYDLSTAVDRDRALAMVEEDRAVWGRVKYAPEVAIYILAQIAAGETLSATCRDLGMVVSTWDAWLKREPGLTEAYRQARILGADAIADDILNIVDNVAADAMQIAKARLRTDMRLKLLAKWQPAQYGDKLGLEHSGPEGQPMQVAYVNVADIAKQMRSVLAGKTPPEALLEHAEPEEGGEESDVL